VCKSLQSEAGKSSQLLSYVHSVEYITIQWGGDGRHGVVDGQSIKVGLVLHCLVIKLFYYFLFHFRYIFLFNI